ncbi:transposase [Sphingomonas sp. UYEF23]|uniref:transposase n=1 Tax=Sphingomonas sp. UYEF23 TaxID=1756408 RepID=UPI0033965781
MTPLIVGQPMNRAVLLDYASQYLVPALQGGDIVRCLRVSSRKDTETAQIIADKGATSRFLLRYSPGLNPIEMAISKKIAPDAGTASVTVSICFRPTNAETGFVMPKGSRQGHQPL